MTRSTRRRVVLVAFWLGGTLFAMLLATLAVQLAGAKVTDRSVPAYSRKQVKEELTIATTIPVRRTTSTSTSTPEGVPTDVDTTIAPEVTTPPKSTILPKVPTTTKPFQSSTSVVEKPPPTPPRTEPTAQRTVIVVGGTATIHCVGNAVSLVSATPKSGFQLQVTNPGPSLLELHFVGTDHKSILKGRCVSGKLETLPTEVPLRQ